MGAAWSAPIIVVVTSAPAQAAASGPADLAIAPGGTAAVAAVADDALFFDLVFTGLSITVPGPALEPGQLALTATFAPDTPGGAAGLVVYGQPDEATGWLIAPADGESGTVSMVYGSAVPSGAEVQLPDGDFFGTSSPADQQTGSFVLTASAPGYSSATSVFATGPAPSGRVRRAAVRYERPRP